MNDNKIETHESYGMININNFSGGDQVYFGSSIKHSGGISISISEAEVERNLNTDWYHGKNIPLIEIEMSHSQFAEMLTTGMNSSGTPCTIKYKNGKKMESPNFKNKRLMFEEEFESDIKKIATKFDSLLKTVNDLQNKKSISKKDKEDLLMEVKMVKQHIDSNIPFVAKLFNEQMDKTVTEAKAEIEGFYETKIRNLGINALTNGTEIPKIEE